MLPCLLINCHERWIAGKRNRRCESINKTDWCVSQHRLMTTPTSKHLLEPEPLSPVCLFPHNLCFSHEYSRGVRRIICCRASELQFVFKLFQGVRFVYFTIKLIQTHHILSYILKVENYLNCLNKRLMKTKHLFSIYKETMWRCNFIPNFKQFTWSHRRSFFSFCLHQGRAAVAPPRCFACV